MMQQAGQWWMARRAVIGSVLLGILLSGCVSAPRHVDDADHALTAATDTAFRVQGRFSVQYEKEAFAARFDWQHAPSSDAMDFISPMGATVGRLTRDNDTIAVYHGEDSQRTQTAANWETLTQQTLGFPLPVSGLVYWIRGAPAPETPAHLTRDVSGRIDAMRQQGWTVQYSYATATARLPERLDVHYGETIALRIKIDSWTAAGLPAPATEE